MKTLILIFAMSLTAANLMARSEDAPPPRDGGEMRQEGRRGESQTLTSEQKAKVADVLAKYKASTMTAADARAIHEAFRDAGLRDGPALKQIMEEAGFDLDKLRDLDPPPDKNMGEKQPSDENKSDIENSKAPVDNKKEPVQANVKQKDRGGDKNRAAQKYCIEQAISDQAQLHTIAFSGLAFITGDFGASTFIPPGKVCDFFGFQYMRDIDAAQKGHNPIFLNRVAGNVLHILNDKQRVIFEQAARQEAEQLRVLAEKRFPLIKAFCRELNAEIPSGSKGLNKEAVVQYVGDIFAFDAELSYTRARIFGQIASSFTPTQKEYLAKMKFGDFNTWPDVDVDKYKLPRGTEKLVNVAYMTYASEFFSWYAGSVNADIYFCPERHGTYFGGFYMKDMPAMGKRDYDISTSVTGDSGKEFINNLTREQRNNITAIPDTQRKDLQEIIAVRRAISTELRKFINGGSADKEKIIALGRRYGELDGEMSYYYAAAFAKVNRTLTAAQRQMFIKLRNLDGYTSAPAYIYSSPVREEVKLPDTDSFFFPPKDANDGKK
ncbi:MAG: Spy/CpxP family protein refolding chaperone [Lentisphaerota bacterium]